MKIREFFSTWFNRAMTEPDVNSRIVFLANGLSSAICILALVTAFLFVKEKTGYDMMVLAVSGGAVGHGVSRYLTKKTGGDDKGDKGDANAS